MSLIDPHLRKNAQPISALMVTDLYFNAQAPKDLPAIKTQTCDAQAALAQMFDYFGSDLD